MVSLQAELTGPRGRARALVAPGKRRCVREPLSRTLQREWYAVGWALRRQLDQRVRRVLLARLVRYATVLTLVLMQTLARYRASAAQFQKLFFSFGEADLLATRQEFFGVVAQQGLIPAQQPFAGRAACGKWHLGMIE